MQRNEVDVRFGIRHMTPHYECLSTLVTDLFVGRPVANAWIGPIWRHRRSMDMTTSTTIIMRKLLVAAPLLEMRQILRLLCLSTPVVFIAPSTTPQIGRAHV